MTALKAFAELNEKGDRIDVHFPYSKEGVEAIHEVPGARFVDKNKGGPLWRCPLDLVTGAKLREAFGAGLQLGQALRQWGIEEKRKQRNLRSLSIANDAELKRVPEEAPRIFKAINGDPIPELELPPLPDGHPHPLMVPRERRGYQFADIAMMALTNTLNANQPGTGKTIEWLGAIVESGKLHEGPHMVIAPVRSLENTWALEVERFLPDVLTYTGEDPRLRNEEAEMFLADLEVDDDIPMMIIVNPDFLRIEKIWDAKRDVEKEPPPKDQWARKDHKGNIYGYRNDLQRRVMQTKYATLCIDEFHKHGMGNSTSLFRLSLDLIEADLRCDMSGTPVGGKPVRLFPVLQHLHPQEYTSKWRWAEHWLEIDDDGFGKTIGDIKPGREDAFYEEHARHMIRRLKREALPGLPPKVIEVVECPMTPGQNKQYEAFAKEAEIKIEEERLSGTNVLVEYARLKQFANAKCTVKTRENRKGEKIIEVHPTDDSGKLPVLLQKLDEVGIRKNEPEPGARAIVASESKRMIEMVCEYLRKAGIDADLMTGDTKDTRPLIKKFQGNDKKPYVLCMTTTTGGVSLNLERAGSVHVLDETWNPDDQEQLEDRGDRGSRTTPLLCFYYRTRGTIQEYIAEVTEGKAVTNRNILDVRRQMRQRMAQDV